MTGRSLYTVFHSGDFMTREEQFDDITSASLKAFSFPKAKWKSSPTQTIRVPKVLAKDILKFSVFLDNQYISSTDERFCFLPINKLYLKLDEIQNSKKSLTVGIAKFKLFLTSLVKEHEI